MQVKGVKFNTIRPTT